MNIPQQITGINGYFSRIQKGITLNVLIQIADNLGLAFAEYYFKIHGLALYKLILIYAISPLVSLPIVVLCNNWKIQRYMRYGILAYIAMSLSLIFLNSYSYLLFGIFNGLTLAFFWVSFNYVFFLKSSNDHHAKDSSIYFILGPLVGVILPPLGALVIGSVGYRALFFIGILLFLLPLLYVKGDEFNFHPVQSFSKAHQSFKGLKTITFLFGAMHYFQGSFLAIYILLFLKTQYQVGGLLSYLALTGLVVSFLLSWASDKFKSRIGMLYPILFTMGVLILIIPTLKGLAPLIAISGAYAFFDNLSLPIRYAVVMDNRQVGIGYWRVNEFYGNIGRTVIFGVSSLLLYLGSKWIAFAIFAAMTFIFPFIVSWKLKVSHQTVA